MSEDKKKVNATENQAKETENEKKEVSLENLDEVTGGSIKNVRYTKTTDISKSTKLKI